MTMLAVPASALAVTGVASDTQAAQPALQASVSPRRLAVNHQVVVRGTAPSTDAGRSATLQTAFTVRGVWHTLARTRIGSTGRFTVRARLRHSGYLRVVAGQPLASAAGVSAATATAPGATRVLPIAVRARFALRARQAASLGGGTVSFSGHLWPARAGRIVRLQARAGHGWRTLARGRTGRRGGFRIRTAAAAGADRRLRVLFAGDRANAPASAAAGRVRVFYPDTASWYDDAGVTACGYHAGLGVANRTLPCGTKVTFRHGGRTVTATVDDRGPYVGGRNWDLNQNTAAALGFGGVGTVWVAR